MDPTDAVAQHLGALATRDLDSARSIWSDTAVWHLRGRHDLAADYGPDEYFDLLRKWFEDFPDYSGEDFWMQPFGEDVVVAHATTSGGRYDGRATGLMIFRVEHGLIAEGWAIPTFAAGAYPF